MVFPAFFNTVVECLYFQSRISGSKHGTAKQQQMIMKETKMKIVERVEGQEEDEVTEEIHNARNGRGFSLSEEAQFLRHRT